jgi:predicted homoserine dehydrogenase-like protein
MPAERSLASGALPIGLTNGVKMRRAVASGEVVTWSDVSIDETSQTVRVRREMETMFSPLRFPEGHRLAR